MKTNLTWIDAARHDYPCHPKNYRQHSSRNIEFFPVHYTGNQKDTAVGNAKYFTQPVYRMNAKGKLIFTPASAHFFVDDFDFYQSVMLKDEAFQVGAVGTGKYYHPKARNSNSIGIELCTSGGGKISEKTKDRGAGLIAYLFILFGYTADEVDTRVIRHWDVTRKVCPAQMIGVNNAEWIAFKQLIREKIFAATAPKPTTDYSLVYNADFYYNKYKDQFDAAHIITPEQLLNHFEVCGMDQLWQAKADFDPVVYKNAPLNDDLRAAFGDDNKKYYLHYIQFGHDEPRVHC